MEETLSGRQASLGVAMVMAMTSLRSKSDASLAVERLYIGRVVRKEEGVDVARKVRGSAPCPSPTSLLALSPEISLVGSFIHAHHFLSAYYVPNTMLGAGVELQIRGCGPCMAVWFIV